MTIGKVWHIKYLIVNNVLQFGIYINMYHHSMRSHPAQPWRRPLMVRQPYSVAVLSTGGRLHLSFLRREGLVRMWSSLWLKGDGGIRKTPSLMVKKDGMILEKLLKETKR